MGSLDFERLVAHGFEIAVSQGPMTARSRLLEAGGA
jgi:hypothetical protein